MLYEMLFLCCLIARFYSNVQWGQLSNLMSLPSDCPQRDERKGWLGDAGQHSNTQPQTLITTNTKPKYRMN